MNADGLLRLADDICAYTTGVKGPARDELLRLAAHLRAKAGASERAGCVVIVQAPLRRPWFNRAKFPPLQSSQHAIQKTGGADQSSSR